VSHAGWFVGGPLNNERQMFITDRPFPAYQVLRPASLSFVDINREVTVPLATGLYVPAGEMVMVHDDNSIDRFTLYAWKGWSDDEPESEPEVDPCAELFYRAYIINEWSIQVPPNVLIGQEPDPTSLSAEDIRQQMARLGRPDEENIDRAGDHRTIRQRLDAWMADSARVLGDDNGWELEAYKPDHPPVPKPLIS
jgi:hypothetical protein